MTEDSLIEAIACNLREAKVFKAQTGIDTESLAVMCALQNLYNDTNLNLSWHRLAIAFRSNAIVYDRLDERMKANTSPKYKWHNYAALVMLSIGLFSTIIYFLSVLFLLLSGYPRYDLIVISSIALILGVYELYLKLVSKSVIKSIAQ